MALTMPWSENNVFLHVPFTNIHNGRKHCRLASRITVKVILNNRILIFSQQFEMLKLGVVVALICATYKGILIKRWALDVNLTNIAIPRAVGNPSLLWQSDCYIKSVTLTFPVALVKQCPSRKSQHENIIKNSKTKHV